VNIVQVFSSFGQQVPLQTVFEAFCSLSFPAVRRLSGVWAAPQVAQLEFSRVLKCILVVLLIIALQSGSYSVKITLLVFHFKSF